MVYKQSETLQSKMAICQIINKLTIKYFHLIYKINKKTGCYDYLSLRKVPNIPALRNTSQEHLSGTPLSPQG